MGLLKEYEEKKKKEIDELEVSKMELIKNRTGIKRK